MKPRVVASIEARMGSTRLPGKVLMDLRGQPVLTRILDRLRRCTLIDAIILATSHNPEDTPLVSWAESQGVRVHRGSEEDVLLRVVEAHRLLASDIIVEICGDMPLLDPEIVDLGIQTFLDNECDIVTTGFKPSYPMGIDVVVLRRKDLEWIESHAEAPDYREHVSLYYWHHADRYRIINLVAPKRYHAPDYRFVLDHPEDLTLIRRIYDRLEPDFGDTFGITEIMGLMQKEPQLNEINRCFSEYLPV